MIAQALIAGAAVLALSTGAGPEQATPPAAAAESNAARSTHKQVTDHEGTEVTLDLDDAGNVVKGEAKRRDGKVFKVDRIQMKDMKVCIPRAGKAKAKPLCQTLAFVSDATFFKMGTASCTCYVVSGKPYCYGDTCH